MGRQRAAGQGERVGRRPGERQDRALQRLNALGEHTAVALPGALQKQRFAP